jgi:hypothetical protein
MGALTNEKCTACRRDSPLVTDSEMQELEPQITDWMVVNREGYTPSACLYGKEFCRGAKLYALVLSPRLRVIIRRYSRNGDE